MMTKVISIVTFVFCQSIVKLSSFVEDICRSEKDLGVLSLFELFNKLLIQRHL